MVRVFSLALALTLGMVGGIALADDDYEIARGQVEYDWDDGELNFDDLAEMRVNARRVSTSFTQGGEQLVLEGVRLPSGVEATLTVSTDNRFPGAYFLTWALPAGTTPAAITFPMMELDDDWSPNRAQITPNAKNTVVEITDSRARHSILAGWLSAGDDDSVKVGTFRNDLTLEVSGTGTFMIGAFRDLNAAKASFAEMEK